MTERLAPDGAIWLCNQCGKTSTDRFGIHGDVDPFWDATCQKNAVLVERATLRYGGMGRVKHGYPFTPAINDLEPGSGSTEPG